MTQLNALMAAYEFDLVVAIPSVLSVLLALVAIGAFVRMRRVLRALPALEERIAAQSHSLSLLTDTTESCFKALSMQLQFMQSQNVLRSAPRPAAPAVKARRTGKDKAANVGAARRREAISALEAQNIASVAAKPVNGDSQAASLASTFLA